LHKTNVLLAVCSLLDELGGGEAVDGEFPQNMGGSLPELGCPY